MSTLFESAIGDIIDVIVAIGDIIKDDDVNGLVGTINKKFSKKNPYTGSLTRQANKLVMTFPVLMSNTINPETALMISKAIERKMVVILQMLFASSILIQDGEDANVQNVIKKFYTGIDFSTMNIDDVINVLDRYDGLTEGQKISLKRAIIDGTKALSEANLAGLRMPVAEIDMFNEDSLNSYTLHKSGNITKENLLSEDNAVDAYINSPGTIHGAAQSIADDYQAIALKIYNQDYQTIERYAKTNDKESKRMLDTIHSIYKDYQNNLNLDFNKMQAQHEKIQKAINLDLAISKDKREEAMNVALLKKYQEELKNAKTREEREARLERIQTALHTQNLVNAKQDFFKKQLLDSDVKKANEMVPSMLVVDFHVGGANMDTVNGTGIVGVKTRIVPVGSNEIIDRIASKSKDRAKLVNLIKATTGEIKFMKDFVLNIDRAKVDAVARSKRGSVNPMWRVLERRANKANLRKALSQRNDASPITTLVMTTEEVDYLKKTQGIDLNNVSIANDMLNAYNLMGIAIVDESAEVVKYLWDGELNAYEPVSFIAMEKEDREGGGTYKKVINLMAKKQY